MIVIDKLCYQSKLRQVSPQIKFAYAIATLLLCVWSRWVPMAVVVLLINSYLTVGKGGVALSRYLHYLTVPLAFLVLSTLSIVLNYSPTPFDLFALSFGGGYLTASTQGLALALQLVLTALASVSCLYFLSFSTPMPDILWVLGKCHCPKLVIELMLLIYRYIFILLEVASNISISQASRLGQCNYKTAIKSFVALVSALFVRAMKKSSALYDAMESRCYDGTIRVLHESLPPKSRDIVAVILFEGVLLLWFLLMR